MKIEIGKDFAPSKIICVGRNYAEHAKELGNEVPSEPLLFLKAPSAIVFHKDAIVIPRDSQAGRENHPAEKASAPLLRKEGSFFLTNQVEHEGELAVVIGRRCAKLFEDENAFEYVRGYTCLNDVTARDLQRKDVQFTRAKSFDTFCPVGPVIETELDVSDIRVVVRVNGEVRQDGRTSQMVFPVDFLIRYISNMMTLMPGDIIATGTPSGVGPLVAGDVCEVEIEGIGILRNPVE